MPHLDFFKLGHPDVDTANLFIAIPPHPNCLHPAPFAQSPEAAVEQAILGD